jgi:hypothetical protein
MTCRADFSDIGPETSVSFTDQPRIIDTFSNGTISR